MKPTREEAFKIVVERIVEGLLLRVALAIAHDGDIDTELGVFIGREGMLNDVPIARFKYFLADVNVVLKEHNLWLHEQTLRTVEGWWVKGHYNQ